MGRFTLWECRSCRLVFSVPVPGSVELPELYSEAYFTGGGPGYVGYLNDEATHRTQARRYLARLAREGQLRGRLLDVGCATGFFLDEARRAGWDVAGCEVSGYAAAHARNGLGLDVQCAPLLETSYPPASFDVITFFNVLEHIPEPRAVAERVHALLKPGGLLVIETWDRDSLAARAAGRRWHQYSPPFVVSYFNRRSLACLFGPDRWHLARYRPVPK